jgi:hypothetical protein
LPIQVLSTGVVFSIQVFFAGVFFVYPGILCWCCFFYPEQHKNKYLDRQNNTSTNTYIDKTTPAQIPR